MKFIHLTGLRKELNEEAQRRLDEWEGDNYEEPVDSDGKNREFFEDMGIPVPKEILDKEKNLEKDITFTEEDYDSHAVEVLINLDSFSMCIDTIDDESIVFLKDGTYCNVLETKQEISGRKLKISTTNKNNLVQTWNTEILALVQVKESFI